MKIYLEDLERLTHFKFIDKPQIYQYRGVEDNFFVYFKIPYKTKYPKVVRTQKNKQVEIVNNIKKPLSDEKKIFAVEKSKPPYNKQGKTNFNLRNIAGVYKVIKDKKVIYVGYSGSDVYKALYRHFETWKDKTQQRIVFKDLEGLTISVIYCKTKTKARQLEGALILKYKPKFNINQYSAFELDDNDKALIEKMEETKADIYNYEEDLPF